MALFEVPGWSMPTAPTATPSHSSRKRKRGSGNPDPVKIHTAETNVEKLMQTLEGGGDRPTNKKRKQGKGGRERLGKGKEQDVEEKVEVVREKGQRKGKGKSEGLRGKHDADEPVKKNKGRTTKDLSKEQQRASPPVKKASIPKASSTPGLTTLQAQMKQSLDGARFRWINEELYKSDSKHAHEMMREHSNVYSEYHKGFRHQVQSWPTNPVSHYINTLSTYPPKTVIADLGCGDAALARALVPKGFTVLSFDLVSDDKFVVEADICEKIPLPGSEVTEDEGSRSGEGQVVDVVVCALSLMGTNWPGCVREAWRVLRSGGELKIAEVASRFADVEEFISLISSIGFKLKSKDDSNTHFTLFEFKKIGRKSHFTDSEWEKTLSKGSLLKPCEYKRR
ncbi:hypothetical protein JAAARDRAFT_188006 [Jaapia argillacea MUCL 33604]|uniref:Ribosomal RNA-processing protein 8 n=1 Tax=Jaapia argillacea MUCL 33604 TaxID=933084 RepID=A0A067QCA8_9AGAM|nr:hypothetical protein JAAARDRAFT_188006 [Jaapia argillacea MUCL 33604]